MAKTHLTHVKSLKHPATQIEGCKSVIWGTRSTKKTTSSDGNPTVTDRVGVELSGMAVFDNSAAVLQALGNAEGNLVIDVPKKGGAASRVYTLKNVLFDAQDTTIPNNSEPTFGEFRLPFQASPGTADTLLTVVTEADA